MPTYISRDQALLQYGGIGFVAGAVAMFALKAISARIDRPSGAIRPAGQYVPYLVVKYPWQANGSVTRPYDFYREPSVAATKSAEALRRPVAQRRTAIRAAGQMTDADYLWGRQVVEQMFFGKLDCPTWIRLSNAQKDRWIIENAQRTYGGIPISMVLANVRAGIDDGCRIVSVPESVPTLAPRVYTDSEIARILYRLHYDCESFERLPPTLKLGVALKAGLTGQDAHAFLHAADIYCLKRAVQASRAPRRSVGPAIVTPAVPLLPVPTSAFIPPPSFRVPRVAVVGPLL